MQGETKILENDQNWLFLWPLVWQQPFSKTPFPCHGVVDFGTNPALLCEILACRV